MVVSAPVTIMPDRILERIAKESGIPQLLEVLSERLDASDLQSLLLAVYRYRAPRRSPAAVLTDYERNRFVGPAELDPRILLEFDRSAYALLPEGFEPLELSPVCPLGTHSAIATVSQDKVLTTTRNVEVAADSTNLLALESAIRRRKALRRNPRSREPIRLAASQRLVRGQPFDDPHSTSHFRIFSLTTAGRDQGSYRFETRSLEEHIGFYLRLFASATRLAPADVRVALTPIDPGRQSALEAELLPRLAAAFPEVRFGIDLDRMEGRGYYEGMSFKIYGTHEGDELDVGDGGFTSWTQELLSNQKERLLISAVGSQRICSLMCA